MDNEVLSSRLTTSEIARENGCEKKRPEFNGNPYDLPGHRAHFHVRVAVDWIEYEKPLRTPGRGSGRRRRRVCRRRDDNLRK